MDDKAKIAQLEAQIAALTFAASLGGAPATLTIVRKKVPTLKSKEDKPKDKKPRKVTAQFLTNWGLIMPGTKIRISDHRKPEFDWEGVYISPTCFRRILPDGKFCDYVSLNQFAKAQRETKVDAKLITSSAVDAWKVVEFQSNVDDNEWLLMTAIRKPVAQINVVREHPVLIPSITD